MDGSLWVILPTYDEAENIEAVVGGIRAAVPEAHVLVVDDNSRDGTGEIADALAGADDHVEVLHRPGKAGLGRAYTAGFAYVARRRAPPTSSRWTPTSRTTRPTCRGCSRPRCDGADLVLGSRYVDGGGIENWSLQRRVISLAGCGYARARARRRRARPDRRLQVLPRRRAADDRRRRPPGAQGYAFQVELTWRVLSLGLEVVEVPIRFRERRLGESKMSAQIALEAAWRVPALRYGPRRWRPLEMGVQPADPLVHEG